MDVICNPSELTHCVAQLKAVGKSIGFVPTMGALHEGHLSLIKRARSENDVVVCSIFVNPKQFNELKDFQNYPKTPQADLELLENEQADIVFMPSVDDIYHQGHRVYEIDLGHLDQVMEGKSRPGHFKGVVSIVGILFELVNPDRAYFGKKDFQQLMVIKRLAEEKFQHIHIVGMETLRAQNGLALSSRNNLLSPQGLEKASAIYQALLQAKALWNDGLPKNEIAARVFEIVQRQGMEVEYFEIAEADTLKSLNQKADSPQAVAFIAVRLEGVRLIDNMQLN